VYWPARPTLLRSSSRLGGQGQRRFRRGKHQAHGHGGRGGQSAGRPIRLGEIASRDRCKGRLSRNRTFEVANCRIRTPRKDFAAPAVGAESTRGARIVGVTGSGWLALRIAEQELRFRLAPLDHGFRHSSPPAGPCLKPCPDPTTHEPHAPVGWMTIDDEMTVGRLFVLAGLALEKRRRGSEGIRWASLARARATPSRDRPVAVSGRTDLRGRRTRS